MGLSHQAVLTRLWEPDPCAEAMSGRAASPHGRPGNVTLMSDCLRVCEQWHGHGGASCPSAHTDTSTKLREEVLKPMGFRCDATLVGDLATRALAYLVSGIL